MINLKTNLKTRYFKKQNGLDYKDFYSETNKQAY